jgi:hypothetical protein
MSTRTVLPQSVDLSSQLNGSKVTFTFSVDYIAGTLEVFLNGLRLRSGIDFTEGTKSFTLTGEDAPASGEDLIAKFYPSEALAASTQTGYPTSVRQIADQFGVPRIMYD